MSTTFPTYTGNADGNIITSASLAASTSTTGDYDAQGVYEVQVHVLNTPGGTVSATRGVRIDVYRKYGNGPTVGESPFMTFTLPSATISTAESIDFFLPTGIYQIKLTNLDAAQAVTVEVTGDTVDNLTTI